MLLTLAVPMWAGEKTITISRNDVDWESAHTVYNITKGGVQLVMSGGMNNPNFLLMKQQTTMTIKSLNYNIKKIVFHCLDNTNVGAGDETFYNGPQTMDVAENTTLHTIPGRYTSPYNGNTYDGYWTSTFSGTISGHTSYADGFPAGYELMFTNGPRPIRFASIDIVLEQDKGDIYELVTKNSQIKTNVDYMLVGRADASTSIGRAMSTTYVSGSSNSGNDGIRSTEVELIDNGFRVRANDEVQFIHLSQSTFTTPGNMYFPWYLNVNATQSIKTGSTERTGTDYNNGFSLEYQNTPTSSSSTRYRHSVSISINNEDSETNFDHDAVIKFYNQTDLYVSGLDKYANCQIRHNNDINLFRNIRDNSSTRQKVFLYKPAEQFTVTTEVQPDDAYGAISLRDGVLVDNGTNWSQEMETIQFLVTPAEGKKIQSVSIAYADDATTTIEPLTVSPSINGTLYTFLMPGHNVHIIATFADVTYHNIYTVVAPSGDYGNIFLTEGYVVQQDQVKSSDGETVVFNVTPNLININDESEGYHELYSVVVTNKVTGEEIPYTYADGNYTFTMPDADVTITATFIYDNGNPLYLLGTANGGEFLPYGPRFNYDNTNQEYYIDVYFKGTNEFGGNTDDAYGYFCLSWGKWTTWNEVNQQTRRGQPYENNYLISTDAPQYTLCYDDSKQNAFKIPAGIYRIYVKSYGYHNDVLRIERTYPSLTFDPAGGADAASAVEVPQHQVVSLVGDLYSKIKAINPDEADGNFMYKATPSVGDAAQATQSESAGASTTTIATLDVLNEGETVTKLDGVNYLGWIVAENTGYYKVIDTPLHWIERDGVKDKTYTVSDRLQGVYAQDGHLWCKDLGDQSIVKTSPNTDAGQIDFLGTTLKTADHRFAENMRINNWDQSNWVELDFTGLGTQSEAVSKAQALVNKYIKAGSVTGVYSDDVNYAITLTAEPTSEDGAERYVPNTYCTANFLEDNLTADGVTIGEGENAKNYYFLNPKVQEYAIVTFAMWDKTNQIMVIPDNTPFNGAVKFGRWDWNNPSDQLDMLNNDNTNPLNAYEFHVIVQRANKSYGTPATASGVPAIRATDSPSGKTDQTASTVIMAQPLDLEVEHPLPTGINGVVSDAKVVGVEYVNLAGVRSSKPFAGMNIVVTRYSDGTFSTTKVVK